MKITLYHSPFCPRCRAARNCLMELLNNRKEIELEEIDVFRHPFRAWTDGIRMFPAVKIEEKVVSGFFLGKEKLQKIIDEG